jgi:hypothetical protein
LTAPHNEDNTMPAYTEYNVDRELSECLELIYEILIDLEDIRKDLKNGKSTTRILRPLFDPFKTIGKY